MGSAPLRRGSFQLSVPASEGRLLAKTNLSVAILAQASLGLLRTSVNLPGAKLADDEGEHEEGRDDAEEGDHEESDAKDHEESDEEEGDHEEGRNDAKAPLDPVVVGQEVPRALDAPPVARPHVVGV